MSKLFSIILVALMAISVAACGGGGKTCDDGTVAEGGKCVPLCTDGQSWDGTACAAALECAAGTHEENGTCVSDITGCAAGTELVNGQCVPACADGEYYDVAAAACAPIPECGTGTTWNEATAQCEPDIDDCAPGTSLVDGQCVPDVVCGPDTHPEGGECVPNTLPDPDVTEDDILFTVPAADETVSLGGTVDTPVDEDGDGIADMDVDQFQFQGQAGDYLNIMAISEGATLPSFALLGLDANDEVIFQRIGINPSGLISEREVYLPYDAVYVLLVTDYNHMISMLFGSDTIPVGGADFTYYVEVTNLGMPMATDIDSLPAMQTGDLDDGGLQFFNLVGLTAGELYTLTSIGQPMPDVPADLYPELMLFDTTGMLASTVAAAPGGANASVWYTPAADGDHLLVQDFDLAVGPNRDFAFGVVQEAMVDCAVDDCTAGDLEEGESEVLSWDLLAGDMIVVGVYLPAGATETLNVALLDSDAMVLAQSQATADANAAGWYYAEDDTTVMLYVSEASGGAVVAYTTDPRVISTPLLEAGQSYANLPTNEMPAGTLPTAGVDHFTATAGQMVFFSGFVTNNPALDWVDPLEQIYTPFIELFGPAYDVRGGGTGSIDPVMAVVPWDGDFLHLVWDPDNDAGIIGASYDVTMNVLTPNDVGMPADGSPVDVPGATLNADVGFGVFAFTASAGGTTEITVTPAAGTTILPEVWLMGYGEMFCFFSCDWYPDPTMIEVAVTDGAVAAAEGEAVTLPVGPAYDGPMFVIVSDAGGNAGAGDTFDLNLTVIPPPAIDTCDGAEIIDVSSGYALHAGTTVGSTSGPENISCSSGSNAGPDVWYTFTLDADSIVTIETLDIDHGDTAIEVFDACGGTSVACSDDEGEGYMSLITDAPMAAGQYFLVVDAWSSEVGSYDIEITVTAQ